MAAPQYVPVPPAARVRSYESPDHVPTAWMPDRPAELKGRQPAGGRLGAQGPDQGYALVIAERFRSQLRLTQGEHADDAIAGCSAIALRRASRFGRAPVRYDFDVAFTAWGFLDASPPADLVAARKRAFEGVANAHHYELLRAVADAVPMDTLELTPAQVQAAYPARWRALVGADAIATH